jgi:uncharacterized protein YajQ (UPF0234 family)
MPSFDIVSKVDEHELRNAIDQANREITSRFDFKGVDAEYSLSEKKAIIMKAPSDFQVKQMDDILRGKLSKRGIDTRSLDYKKMETNLSQAQQEIEVKQGLDTANSKKIIKLIKDKKLKVQANIQGDQVRVTGKKRDELQETIAFLKESFSDLPLQYENFRD